MWHLPVAAHWVLLLAILFCLQNRGAVAWCALLGLTLALNVYLFVMVFAIWIASLFARARRKLGVSPMDHRLLWELLGGVVVVSSVLAIAGHLTYLGDCSVQGAGLPYQPVDLPKSV